MLVAKNSKERKAAFSPALTIKAAVRSIPAAARRRSSFGDDGIRRE
jgi:hypothetical protein